MKLTLALPDETLVLDALQSGVIAPADMWHGPLNKRKRHTPQRHGQL
jgi:hypothetical protein